jgi:hypothetical protein
MGYQYDRQRCSNAAPARVESLRAAVSTTDQWVVAKTSGNLLGSRAGVPGVAGRHQGNTMENWRKVTGNCLLDSISVNSED